MSEEWIIVPNWDKFQHYGNRAPVWIKVYLELRDKDEYRHLTYAQRGCLVTIWVEYGASKGVLRVSSLAQKSGQKTRRQHLEALLQAGFIELVASKPLALARSREKKEIRKDALARASEPSDARASAEENNQPERDPEALERIKAISAKIGRPL